MVARHRSAAELITWAGAKQPSSPASAAACAWPRSDSGRDRSACPAQALTTAPLRVVSFLVSYALLTALLVRMLAPLLRPGWHPEEGATRWALWLTEVLTDAANGVLFPLYLSVYTRSWLRLLGLRVGKRTEVSISSGLNRLTSFGETSFAADAVCFAHARSRAGWIQF